MADQNAVPIPQGATIGDAAPAAPATTTPAAVPIPAGATIGEAVAAPPPNDFGTGGTGVVNGLVTGFEKEANKTGQGVINLLNAGNRALAGGAGGDVPSLPVVKAGEDLNTHGAAETIGGGAENIAEFAAGDEALSGLARAAKIVELGDKYPLIKRTLDLAKAHPVIAKMITEGAKAGTIGAGQGAAKGAAEGNAAEGAKEGAVGGAVGGATGSALGEGLEAITNSDIAKAMMNRSTGATKNMVRYANPADALVSEDLPAFKTLTNQGRKAAAQVKINELKPQLDAALSQSPAVLNWQDILAPSIREARQNVAQSLTMTPEAKTLLGNQIDAFENNLTARYPTGEVKPLEANQLKSQIGKEGAEFDTRPDASDTLRNLYTAAYGDLKNAVNKAVPEIVPLNQRVSNLLALKNATEETILAEKAGIGPLSGFGTARKLEAAAGHVAPVIAKGAKAVKPALAKTGAVIGAEGPRLFWTASDGSEHSSDAHPDAPAMVHDVDPGAKFHGPLQ